MGEQPGSHEEAELDLGLFRVSRMHVHDTARELPTAMSDAAVTQERLHERVEERRLADADLEGHRFDYLEFGGAVDQTTV